MVQQRYRIVHTDVNNNNLQNDLSQVSDISVTLGIGKRIDTFKIRVRKKNVPSNIEISAEDGIDIYLGNGGGTPTSLIISGKIKDIDVSVDIDNCSVLTISGQNKLETLLSQLKTASYKDKTASFIVNDIIDYANLTNGPNDTDFSKSITTTSLNTSYFKRDGNLFQQIEEISTNEYTGAGTFVFYLQSDNTFVWKPRPSSPSSNLRESVDFLSFRPKQAIWKVVNWLIIHAGDDLNGSPIRTYQINVSSIGKVGPKQKYVSWTDLAKEYIDKNPGASNATVRADVRNMARQKAAAVLRETGSPSWQITGLLRGRSDLVSGNLYLIESDTLSWTGTEKKLLRLTQITHTYSARRGWRTEVQLQEDEDISLSNFDEGV